MALYTILGYILFGIGFWNLLSGTVGNEIGRVVGATVLIILGMILSI